MSIAFRRVILPRHHERIATGQSVTIMAEVIDTGIVDARVTPTQVPLISLYNPLSTLKVEDATMTFVENGLYNYTYRVRSTEPLGVWTGNFTLIANDNLNVARLERISLFKTIISTDFADVSYLGINDQGASAWYWWIDAAGQIVTARAAPSFLIKDAVALASATPYWIQLINGASQTRYLHPNTLGEFTVSTSQPGVGTGVIGSYTWKAENGQLYTLALDILDQIVVTAV